MQSLVSMAVIVAVNITEVVCQGSNEEWNHIASP